MYINVSNKFFIPEGIQQSFPFLGQVVSLELRFSSPPNKYVQSDRWGYSEDGDIFRWVDNEGYTEPISSICICYDMFKRVVEESSRFFELPGVLFTMADYDIKEVRRVVRMMEGLE